MAKASPEVLYLPHKPERVIRTRKPFKFTICQLAVLHHVLTMVPNRRDLSGEVIPSLGSISRASVIMNHHDDASEADGLTRT